jgi:hypothetical protein
MTGQKESELIIALRYGIQTIGEFLNSGTEDLFHDSTVCFKQPTSETVGATEDPRDLRKTRIGQKESKTIIALRDRI